MIVHSTLCRATRGFARRASTVATLDTAHPGDMRALEQWLSQHPTARPRCVLGKTEGNGCVNDFSRGFASHTVEAALGARRGDASIIMSGGTEGVLTPHLLLFAEDQAAADGAQLDPSPRGGLAFGVARTRTLLPDEIGRRAQVLATRDAVLEACAEARVAPSLPSLCLAQIKCPLLTPERVAAAASACATDDGYHSMALSRGASSLGIALATGELPMDRLDEALDGLCTAPTMAWAHSAIASASAGIELEHSEVFVLGNSPASASPLRAATTTMTDAIDAAAVHRLLAAAGLHTVDGSLTPEARARVRAVLAKADPAASVRGRRTTMLSDSDLHATRHARASVGGLLAGVVGDPRLYVSGGAEHQGPVGGGPVCVIYEAVDGD